jgi:toxin HigB-1
VVRYRQALGGTLEIRFLDKKLRELCESSAVAERKLGPPSASKLRRRLADLRAAATVAELVAGRPHPLTGDRAGQFSLELAKGDRLVFSPANDPVPRTEDGAINWSQVTLIRIDYIGDYHD